MYSFEIEEMAQGVDVPCEHVTMRPVVGAMSTLVTVLSWPLSSSCRVNLLLLRV